MPLVSTGQTLTLVGTIPRFVSLSMEVQGSDPPAFVTVLASSESIAALDPMGALGQRDALEVARGDRMRIESAASTKFDRLGIDGVNHTLTLGAHDFP